MRKENPNSHKYEVENCIKIVKVFLAIDGYVCLIVIQMVSIDNSSCLILNARSLDKEINSSSDNFK